MKHFKTVAMVSTITGMRMGSIYQLKARGEIRYKSQADGTLLVHLHDVEKWAKKKARLAEFSKKEKRVDHLRVTAEEHKKLVDGAKKANLPFNHYASWILSRSIR